MKYQLHALLFLASCSPSYAMQENNPNIANNLLNAVERGLRAENMTELLQLLKDKNNNPNYTNESGLSPLLYIAQFRSDPKFRGFEPLHTAMMKALLSYGARRDIKDRNGSYADLWAKYELDALKQELNNATTK